MNVDGPNLFKNQIFLALDQALSEKIWFGNFKSVVVSEVFFGLF